MKFLAYIIYFAVLSCLFSVKVFAAGQWSIQSIDTMKYSQDQAQIELNDPGFDHIIDQHVKNIAESGANYIAIDTPYEDEFVPFLERWVDAARKYHLHVWFRGNLAGWEGLFGYPKISRAQHIAGIKAFILNHPDIFADGDIFNSCRECENGGPGYPTTPAQIAGFRSFLIEEYQTTQQAFAQIHKNVRSNFYSMNGDLAKHVMDKPTTQALGGVVTIDHYVRTPDQLSQDIDFLARYSGGKVVLGEFGAPIPEIHGAMTEDQQAQWVREVLQDLTNKNDLLGMNYWVDVGGSTALWRDDGSPKPVQMVLQDFYKQQVIQVKILNEIGLPVAHVQLYVLNKIYSTNNVGIAYLPYYPTGTSITVFSQDYQDATAIVGSDQSITIRLVARAKPWWEQLLITIKKFFHH